MLPQRPQQCFIDVEAKQISSKEEELLKKARDLENEMRAIRQAKLDVVVR